MWRRGHQQPALLTVIIVAPSLTAQRRADGHQRFRGQFRRHRQRPDAALLPMVFQYQRASGRPDQQHAEFLHHHNNGGYYSVVVSNIFGSATSSPALLTIVLSTNAPVITQPRSR